VRRDFDLLILEYFLAFFHRKLHENFQLLEHTKLEIFYAVLGSAGNDFGT
jgi:uncharacterized membrane protein